MTETRKLLVLSTGHVTDPATRKMLTETSPDNYPTLGGSTHYGWFCYASDENDGVGRDRIPDDLWACMLFARANGADYILFDADGDQVDGLPWVEF